MNFFQRNKDSIALLAPVVIAAAGWCWKVQQDISAIMQSMSFHEKASDKALQDLKEQTSDNGRDIKQLISKEDARDIHKSLETRIAAIESRIR